jgi:hypothetical protein
MARPRADNCQFNEAVSNGTDSAFDHQGWLHVPPPEYAKECLMHRTLYKVAMQLIVRLPRLIRLVREVRTNPFDTDAALKAVALADKLLRTDLHKIVTHLMNICTTFGPTEEEDLAHYFPKSIRFRTVCLLEGIIRYCCCRIVVIGLCRKLVEQGLLAPIYGTSTLAEQEIHCAGMIAMSSSWAVRLATPIPMGAFMMIYPLHVAFGSWCRAERDDTDRDGGERARFMMEWCRKKSNVMLHVWDGEQMSSDMLKAQMSVLEGGSLQNWSERRVFPM